MRSASRRRIRTHAEWNVDTHIFWATGPTSASTRDFISSAALFVNVMARISKGLTPSSRMRWAMRWVRTRVLPDPAPATTSSGPSAWVTASDCTGWSPSSRVGGVSAAIARTIVGATRRCDADPMTERVPYDEFSMFHENAEEFGLPWDGPPTVRREAVEVEPGRRLSALVWGSGPPEIVLLHGGAQNAHTWDTVALALDRPLVAVDLPGHGHSDHRDGGPFPPP